MAAATDFARLLRVLLDGAVDGLIPVKRAAGRPNDLEAIAELEALRAESGR